MESLILLGICFVSTYAEILAFYVGELRQLFGEYLYIVVGERRQLLEEFVFSFQF